MWVTANTVTMADQGVVRFHAKASFRASIADTILVGLVQAADSVSIDADNRLVEVWKPTAPAATVSSLVEAVRENRKRDTLGQFCTRFRDLHASNRAMYRPGATTYYTTPLENLVVKHTSTASDNWAYHAERRVP